MWPTAGGLWPHSPAMPLGPAWTPPAKETPPPHPVPRMTAKTTFFPAAAPSVASETARQLASLATRTSRSERLREVDLERGAVKPDGVRVLDQAGSVGDGSGDAGSDCCAFACFGLDLTNQPGHGLDGVVVVVARRVDPVFGYLDPVGVKGYCFNFGATEIYTNPHRCLFSFTKKDRDRKPRS